MLEQLGSTCISALLIALPAFVAAILIFRNAIIRRLNKEHFPPTPQFADTELVKTPPKPLPRTILLGSALYVPQGVNAVVARISPGAQTLFEPGDYIITDIRASVFYYKFVDITLRNQTIFVDDAPTRDGFKVSFWIKISFRVTNPRDVVLMNDPVLELRMLVEDAIRSTTVKYNHDVLIPVPEKSPVKNSELLYWIRKNLVDRAATPDAGTSNDIEIVRGIVIRSIVINDRIGDPERVKYPKTIIVEYENSSRLPENAREELNYQLVDLWKLDGYKGNRMQQQPDGSLILAILIHTKQAVFFYNIIEESPIITNIMLRSSRGETDNVPNSDNYNNYSLLAAVQKLDEKYSSKRKGFSGRMDWD